jgi:hypothetical protein
MENDKISKEASRASQTRAKDVRKKVWTPPSSLDAPPCTGRISTPLVKIGVNGFQ